MANEANEIQNAGVNVELPSGVVLRFCKLLGSTYITSFCCM